jgi:hypothetical protein
MKAFKKLTARSLFSIIPLILLFLYCPGALRAQALIVDCTGANPSAFPSINAALPNATPGTFILVTGPCTENVSLNSQSGITLGAFFGQTATLNGSITIKNAQNVFLYGLNVTNPAHFGFQQQRYLAERLYEQWNAGVGLRVGGMSDVTIVASGAFDHNAAGGMNITGNSLVALVAFAGSVDISNNTGNGVFASQANFSTLGSTTITNNVIAGVFNTGYGIDLVGGAHGQIGALFGPNSISGNQSGGASLQETAEISLFSLGQPNLIQGNGPFGVAVGLGSQVTFAQITGTVNAQITDHTSAGVDLYGKQQSQRP